MESADSVSWGRLMVSFVVSKVSISGVREEASTVSSKVRLRRPWSTSRRNSRIWGGVVSLTNIVDSTLSESLGSIATTCKPFMSKIVPFSMER